MNVIIIIIIIIIIKCCLFFTFPLKISQVISLETGKFFVKYSSVTNYFS
jgi:hypothetical protein